MAVKRGRAAAFSVFKNKKKEDKKTGASSKPQSSASSNKQNNNNQSSNVPRRAQGYTSSAQRGRQNNPTQRNIQTTASNRVAQSQNSRANTPTSAYQKQKATAATSAEMRRQREQNSSVQSRSNQSVSGMNQRMNRTATAKDMAEQKNRNTASTAANMRRQQEYEKIAEERKQNLPSRRDDKTSHKDNERTSFERNEQVLEAGKKTSKAITKAAKNLAKLDSTNYTQGVKLEDDRDFGTDVAKSFKHGFKEAAISTRAAGERVWRNSLKSGRPMELSRQSGDWTESEEEKKFYKNQISKSDLRQAGLREKIKEEQEKIHKLESKQDSTLAKWTMGAASSGGGMAFDRLTGPMSLLTMGVRVTEGARGDVTEKADALKKEMLSSGNYSQEEVDELFKDVNKWDLANALGLGSLEALSEMTFGGIGAAAKYTPAGGILDKAVGKLTGRLGSTAIGRLGLGVSEEIAEEEIGNPLQTMWSNRIYGDKLQAMQEDSIRRAYSKEADTLEDNLATSENINSEEFLEQSKALYKKTGASDEEAEKLALMARDYFNARLEGDEKAEEDAMNKIVETLAGGENSLQEKWTMSDAANVAGSTFIMTALTGLPSVMTTSQKGNEYRQNYGIQGVKNIAKVVENLDSQNSPRAKAVLESIEKGKEPTGTQIYNLITWSNKAVNEAKDLEVARDRDVQARMKQEKLYAPIVDADYNLAPATEERFEDIVEKTIDTIKSLNLNMDEAEMYPLADVVAAYETGTITSEQLNELNIESPENRKAFESATGVNLNEYTVKDKKGNIDEAASNIEMHKALFAKSTENYMTSARIEQEAWNDEARVEMANSLSSNMLSGGSVAVQNALKTVDPMDRGKFMLTGSAVRSVYEEARFRNTSWEDVSKTLKDRFPGVDKEVLHNVFNEAKTDRSMAEDANYGKQVKAGEPMDKKSLKDSAPVRVPGKVIDLRENPTNNLSSLSFITSAAKVFGVNIQLTDNLVAKDAKGNEVLDSKGNPLQVEGTQSGTTILINTNEGILRAADDIAKHELIHQIRTNAPEEFKVFARLAMDRMHRANPEEFKKSIQSKQEQYKSVDENMTPEAAFEEMLANGSVSLDWEQLIADVQADNTIQNKSRLLEAIKNAVAEVLRKLRSMLSMDNAIDDEDVRTAVIDEIMQQQDVYDLLVRAASEAKANESAVAIDTKQDEMNGQNGARESLSLSDDNLTVQGNTAKWTDSRIDSLIRENGASDERYSKAWAAMMSPRDFLKLTIDDGTLDKWMQNENETRPLDEENLRGESQTPFLIIEDASSLDDFSYRVIGHEGRHRMIALMNAGVESVPVVVRGTEATKYKKTSIPELTLASQDYYDGGVNDEARVNASDLVPIKESNRDELIEKFGGDADVRFSISEQQDSDYMKAVESGDMETAQRMVDEAAEKSMPYSILREGDVVSTGDTENGNLIKMYHGSGAKGFTEFNLREGALGKGAYFSSSFEEATDYAIFASEDVKETDDWKYDWNDTEYDSIGEIGDALEEEGYIRAFYLDIRDRNDLDIEPGKVIAVAKTKSAIKSADPVTYDDEGNVIPLSQRFNTESNDVRFSMSEPVEKSGDLIAVHNLSEDKLRGDFRLGGFPMPSIAVTNQHHEDFGEISLLFGSDTIDPKKDKANKVYSADAWTPTVPMTEYEADSDVANKAYRTINELVEGSGVPTSGMSADLHYDNIQDSLGRERGFDGFITRMMEKPYIKYAFLKSQGADIEVPYKEGSLQGHGKDVWDKLDEALPEMTKAEAVNMDNDEAMKLEPIIREIVAEDWINQKEALDIDEEKLRNLNPYKSAFSWGKVTRYLSDLVKFREEGKTIQVVDEKALENVLNDNIDKNAYREWLSNLFDGIVKDSGVRNQTDAFTPSGNRRSFKATHHPATLEGILKAMKEQGEKNVAYHTSTKTLRADTAKTFKSLDEIRKDKGKLQNLSENEVETIYKELDDKFYGILDSIGEKSSREYDLYSADIIADVMSECAKAGYTKPEQIIKHYDNYEWTVSEQDAKDILALFDAIQNMPVNMFEAKPRRAVGFNEVMAAIVPDDTSEDILNELELMEIPVTKYNREVEGDRVSKVNEAADAQQLRFSLSLEQQKRDSDYLKAVESNNMEEAQRLVEEAATSAGYDTYVYHGTGANFTTFDFDKSGRNHGGYSKYGQGFYFTDSEEVANHWGKNRKLMKTYISLDNPFDASGFLTDGPVFEKYKETMNKYFPELSEKTKEPAVSVIATLNEYHGRDYSTKLLKELGYDGVIAQHSPDDWVIWGGTKEYVVFDAENIKSADPVTYAEDGSIIPLSERFNPENKDIRYSLPTIDADGKVLTDGQMEYFKNSQARDEQGRLVPVYHTTNKGGFTVFDPTIEGSSDDHRSLFFASNFDVSQTYGNYAVSRFRINDYEFNSLNDFVEAYRENFRHQFNDPDNDILDQTIGHLRIHVENKNYMPAEDLGSTMFERVKNYIKLAESGDDKASKYRIEMEGPYGGMIRASSYDELMGKLSRHMSNLRSNSGYYKTYLNLENPMIVDANGANWNSIPYGNYNENAVLAIKNITVQDIRGQIYVNVAGDRKVDNEWQEFRESKTIDYELDHDEIPNAVWNQVYDFFIEQGLDDRVADDYADGTFFDYNGLDTYDENGNKVESEASRYRTRQLAEMADNLGHDGVIIRNCYDIGGASSFRGSNPISDIYIAFSSNQVKDADNQNPTENPDIRYSIVDDDEVKARQDRQFAYDNSYEALMHYEEMFTSEDASEEYDLLNDKDVEAYYRKAKRFVEKDVDAFYSGLTPVADRVVTDDPVLEEGRVRMARSKEDFFNSNIAKWNDRWLTDGTVLDVESVKKEVRDLVMAMMQNSDTDRQYKTGLVNKTLIDMRLAYDYAKRGQTDIASAILWHSAQKMIDNVEFYREDDSYATYKDLRDYLRTTKIALGNEYWSDVAGGEFGRFRKKNYGRLKLVKGYTNVDQIYQELEERWPEWFNTEEQMTPPDMLEQISHVLDVLQPVKEAYSSEEAAEVTQYIAEQLTDIMDAGKELHSLADDYKKRLDEKTKAMKLRHEEAMRKVREQRDKGIKAEKAKWQVKEEKRKERASHKKAFKGIEKSYKTLTERLFNNTADSHIPQQYKKELAGLLACFDMQTEGSKKREARTGHVAQKTIKLSAIKTALSSIENNTQLFHVNDAITDIIDELLGIKNGSPSESIDGLTIDELSVTELAKVDKLLKALVHEFNNYEKVRVGTKKQQAADIGKAQVDSALEHAKTFGSGKDYQNLPGFLDNIINLDEVTPAYMFRRIDSENNGLGLMWKEVRRSFDKYVRNQNQLNEWIDDIVGEYHTNPYFFGKYGAGELADWRSERYAKTFRLVKSNGSVTLTPAQMMSIYCLSKRAQAMDHMTGAGIVVAPVSYNAKKLRDVKKRANTALPVPLTEADIQEIISELTPEQIKVAEELQELLSTKMAQWGNEASMDVIGIELFNEKDYFPIKSDKAALTKDLNEAEFAEAIRNFGFTKAVQPGARNAIMVDDIFNVVTEHCNNMNLYNSYSATINDFMKVYNYRDFREDGTEYTVQQAVAHAYSKKATTFIMTFIRDLNGNVSGRASGIENMYNGLLANAKKASVFANLRVAAQQPTAITRAFAEISPKYIKGIKIEKGAMQEMFEHAPIALWKSWGYYDINMGKSIEDIMMNEGKIIEDLATDLYGALDNVTWTAIWQMVKNEMKDTHPDVEIGTDEYWELCNERFSEIIDLTQVVDSPMHRSHAMRDKGFFHKMTTSFMAEPTVTFNLMKAGYVNAWEQYKLGNTKEATKIFARTNAVILLQAAAVSAAAGFVDALRGKGADDDDDDDEKSKLRRILALWEQNTFENFIDELKPYNKIYVVKDIASMFDGWDNKNLALQGFQLVSLGLRQVMGDPYARSSKSWYENLFGGMGYLTGIPVKTMMTGLENAMGLFGVSIPAIDNTKERLDKIAELNKEKRKESGEEGGYFSQLFSMVISDDKTKASANTDTDTDTDSGSGSGSKGGMSVSYEDDAQALYDASREYDDMLADAQKAADGYEGEDRNKRIWQSVSKDYKKYMEIGDIGYLEQMRDVVEEMGGDLEYFDERMVSTAKSTLKKSLSYESGDADLQARIGSSEYLRMRGVTEEEISEVCYKSEMAKDLKVAFRLGDEQLILESAQPLVDAGLTDADWEKLWKNRNRLDIKKYEGKYKDQLKSQGTFIWPTQGTITSHFGRRNAPTAGASSNHPAIDIGAAQGTPVLASDGGVVISAGKNGGYGNSVGIKHDNGMVTYYNHLYGWNVKEGDVVAQGQQIGQVGSTGISTGPHLDFKILDINGNAVDPEQYLQ